MMVAMVESYGIAAERRRREITAHHGVPDFVFRPAQVAKGLAQREIGDFLLWVGDVVAIVSHKSRDPEAMERESQDRRRRWLDGIIGEAYEQIRGVGRALKAAANGDIVLESERGVAVPWDPARVIDYVGVVVVEGRAPDEDYAPPLMMEGVPTIAMFANDWDRLNELLPSTMTMIRYVGQRLQKLPRCPMGAELDVFALLIEHENTDAPLALPDGGLPRGYFEQVVASHPDWFLGGLADDKYALVISSLIEAVADPDPEYSETPGPWSYMEIVEFLDRIPLFDRAKIGRAAIERCLDVGRDGNSRSTRLVVPHGMLVLLITAESRAARAQELQMLTFARHSQALDAGAPTSIRTLGVATSPIPSNGRSHDFVFIRGGIRSDPEFRRERDEMWGAVDMSPLVERWRTTLGD